MSLCFFEWMARMVFAYVERSFFWRSPLLLFPDFLGTREGKEWVRKGRAVRPQPGLTR